MALIERLDDRTLVEQHCAGDDDAFRQIVLRHRRSLYANALRRLGDPVLAEDAVQEAFLRAFRNLDRFEGDYHLDAWLHRILTNACHDIGRRRGRDTRLFRRACTEVERDAPPADDDVLDALSTGRIDDALGQLPDSYRDVLVLRFVEEMSYADVAEKAGISEENARARVSRGRSMLKRMMSGASAALIWAIPPLRRAQLHVADPDAALQTAQRVQEVSGLAGAASATSLGQLSSFVAQAGPALATAAPAATSSAPVLKAVAAAGLAAAVVIPTGVAVDRAIEKPEPRAAAPAPEADEVRADGSDVRKEVAVATSDGGRGPGVSPVTEPTPTPVALEPDDSAADPGDAALPTAAPEPAPEEPAAGAVPDPPPAAEPAPAPAPPAPIRASSMTGELQVVDAGGRLALSGPIVLAIGDTELLGDLDGKLDIAEADPKAPAAAREVGYSTLTLTLADGRILDLNVAGSVVVTERGPQTDYELDLRFSLPGGSEAGLPESGDLSGTIARRGDQGSLTAVLVEAAP